MFWEYNQERRLDRAQYAADRAEAKAERHSHSVDDLIDHVERLSLACQAMWELVRDRSDLTEEDIEGKMLEIDSRDGRVDGKMAPQPFDCPSCGRTTNSRRAFCVMCGARVEGPHKFG